MADNDLPASHRATAERNRGLILDAAAELLGRGAQLTFSALAAEAGVSRPTVYSHFADRRLLLSALLGRATSDAAMAIRSAEPDRAPPLAALRRVVGASWEQLARHQDIAKAAMSELPADSLHAAHHEAVAVFRRILERGRVEGAFRTDLPTQWLATACLALVHAAAATVSSGQLPEGKALPALQASIEDVCVGRASTTGSRRKPRSPRR